MPVIALDLGGTKLAGATLDETGHFLHRSHAKLEDRQGAAVGRLIVDALLALLGFAGDQRINITGVAICVPGISHAESGRVWAPNIPGWENYPLRDELRAALQGCPTAGLPLAIDSDRACYMLGELWKGAAQGCRNAIHLAVGTGIGAGILVDGKILRGAHDIAGAIGWLALERPYRTGYSACGCLESRASGRGIAEVAKEWAANDSAYSGSLRSLRITAQDVFRAFHCGDPIAVKTLDQAVELWGMAAANLVSLFNPEAIIFGGGVFGPGISLLPRILDEAERWAQPIAITQVRFEPSQLGGEAGLYGAGYLALQNRSGNP